MAGERMRLGGHTEVSGAHTHPEHGGHSLAAYDALGFTLRRNVLMTRLAQTAYPINRRARASIR